MNGDPFMTTEDFKEAEMSKQRQSIVYPDTRQETDESKIKGQAEAKLRRQLQRAETPNKKRGLVMPEPKYDPMSGKMTFPKAEAKVPGEKKVKTTTMVAIPIVQVEKLVGFAKQDGADLVADTDVGTKAKRMRSARAYIVASIDQLIAKREGK